MARLLDQERNGSRIDKWWLHTDDTGNEVITVTSTEDVQPVFDAVARATRKRPGSDMHYIASIPGIVIDEVCRIEAARRGCKRREVYAELMAAKTSRAKEIWATLTQGRDFRKFQVQG